MSGALAAAGAHSAMPPMPRFMWQPDARFAPMGAYGGAPIDPYAMMGSVAPMPMPMQMPTQATASVAASGGTKSGSWILAILIAAAICFGVLAWMRSARMRAAEDEEDELPAASVKAPNAAYKAAARQEPREVPPPSSVSDFLARDAPALDADHVSNAVQENLLRYVSGGGGSGLVGDDFMYPYGDGHHPAPAAAHSSYSSAAHPTAAPRADVVDISGFDLPVQAALPPPPSKAASASAATPAGGASKRLNADESEEVLEYARRREALFGDSPPPM